MELILTGVYWGFAIAAWLGALIVGMLLITMIAAALVGVIQKIIDRIDRNGA